MPNDISNLILVLGGARSGKSTFAEQIVGSFPKPYVYVATASAGDAEMADRIDQHRARRGEGWETREAQTDLEAAFDGDAPLLLDCLTLWLSNLMFAEADIEAETTKLLNLVARRGGPVVMVSNEVGMGLVPDNALGRRFRDAQGLLNQRIAARAERVAFVASGLPIWLKGTAL